MGMSTVPLSELYAGAARFLEDNGAERPSQHQRRVRRLGRRSFSVDHHHPRPARSSPISSSSRCLSRRCRSCCRTCRPRRTAKNSRARSSRHEHWPICSVHLWFDREITDLDHAVLLDREIHWMYNKGVLQPWRKHKGSYLELVVSASRAFAALDREQAIDQALVELAEFFPGDSNSKARKGRARQGSPRHLRCAAGNRRRSAPTPSPRGPIASSPATGSPPAGPPRWRAPRARATSPPRLSAPAESKTVAFSSPI